MAPRCGRRVPSRMPRLGGNGLRFQAVVNVVLLHRDIGIVDGFDCPLPNGYALSFIDVTEIGQEHDNAVDSDFLLGTKTGKRTDFKTYAELRGAAQQLRIQTSLVPIGSLYSKYRFRWCRR